MPRASRQQSEEHRLAITESAARLMRERGVDGLSVADLMASAGLTHGGFYGHFDSKEALAASACRAAFAQSVRLWNRRVANAADTSLARRQLIEAYLSRASRNSPGTSCPAPALASDVARSPASAPIRAAYCEGTEALLAILASIEPGATAGAARRAAVADFALLLGALMLARATAGHALSEEALSVAQQALIAPNGSRTRTRGTRRTET